MYSNKSVRQASVPKLERAPMEANAAHKLTAGHHLFAIQQHAGNRALSSLLQRKSSTAPIQRFQDGGIDIDISTLMDPIQVNDYIKREKELGITSIEMGELEVLFQQLISAVNDPAVLFDLIDRKAALTIDGNQLKEIELQFIVLIPALTDPAVVFEYLQKQDQFVDSTVGSKLNERLEELKYDKGLEMEVEEHNYDHSMIVERSNLLDKINTAGSKVTGYQASRYKPTEKKRKLDEDLRNSFTREGSVGFDLEGKYTGNNEEMQERKKKSKKSSDEYNKGVRTAAERLDLKHREANFDDPEPKGTNMMKFDPAIYEHEGVVGIYGEIGTTGPKDFFEYDHQPQNDLIEAAAGLSISSGKNIKKVALKHSIGGMTIVLKHERHAAGATYGRPSVHKPAMEAVESMTGKDDEKIAEAKSILVKATAEDAQEILDIYDDYKKNYEDIDDLFPDTDTDKAEALKKKIHARVKQGEARIQAQTFDDWFKSSS